MTMTEVRCPPCGTVLKSSRLLPAGAKIQCKKCANKFFIRVPAAVVHLPAPARVLKLQPGKRAGVNSGILTLIVVVGLVFVGSGIALTVYCLTSNPPTEASSHGANTKPVGHRRREVPPPPRSKNTNAPNQPVAEKKPAVKKPASRPLLVAAKKPAPQQPPPNEKMVIVSQKPFEAVLTYHARVPKMRVTEWVFMTPKPPELPGQTTVSAVLEPAGHETLDSSPLRRPLLWARILVKDKKLEHEITFRVKHKGTLRSRLLVPVSAEGKAVPVPLLTSAERRAALASVSLLDFKSATFQKWLDANKLRRGQREADLAFARRAFQGLQAVFTFAPRTNQDRHASALCKQKGSDCGGNAIMLVAVLRANGIPARALVGDGHVKAEFYAAGIGWVPADVTFNRFGDDDGDLLILHVDFDLVLDRKETGRHTVLYCQSAIHWVTGEGSTQGSTIRTGWGE